MPRSCRDLVFLIRRGIRPKQMLRAGVLTGRAMMQPWPPAPWLGQLLHSGAVSILVLAILLPQAALGDAPASQQAPGLPAAIAANATMPEPSLMGTPDRPASVLPKKPTLVDNESSSDEQNTVAPLPGPAQRIITLSPGATEFVYAAGGGHLLVAVDINSDYPPEIDSLPRIGDVVQLNEEKIIRLQPDLVIGWRASANTESLAGKLARLHIPLLYLAPASLDDIPMMVRMLGHRLGTQAAANRQADALAQEIRDLRPASGPPLTVFLEIGTNPLFTIGNDPLINDVLHHCAGRNIYAGSSIAAPQVSIEAVLHADPDVLILSPYGGESLQTRRRWWQSMGLAAARENRMLAIDPDWLHRPGPRLVKAAQAICHFLQETLSREAVHQGLK